MSCWPTGPTKECATIEDSPKRIDTARKSLEEMGGRFLSVFVTMGMYDLIITYDAPDDAVAARFSLLLGKMGNVRTCLNEGLPRRGLSADREYLTLGKTNSMVEGARTPLTVDLTGYKVAISAGANGIGKSWRTALLIAARRCSSAMWTRKRWTPAGTRG